MAAESAIHLHSLNYRIKFMHEFTEAEFEFAISDFVRDGHEINILEIKLCAFRGARGREITSH